MVIQKLAMMTLASFFPFSWEKMDKERGKNFSPPFFSQTSNSEQLRMLTPLSFFCVPPPSLVLSMKEREGCK